MTLDEPMSHDTAGSIRSRAVALSLSHTRNVLGFAHSPPHALQRRVLTRANAARSELVHQVHPVARLAEQGPEALPLDRLLELAVLALFEVADRDDGLLGPAE
jgi:hypothetical protein